MAKTHTMPTRVYENGERIFFSSVYDLEVDPVEPYKDKLLAIEHEAAIVQTPLLQVYVVMTLEPGIRMIIGPTRVLVDDEEAVDELLRKLKIKKENYKKYKNVLYSLPAVHINRIRYFLVFTLGALKGKPIKDEDVWLGPEVEKTFLSTKKNYLDNIIDIGIDNAYKHNIDWEELIFSYVEAGRTKRIQEVFKSPPKYFLNSYGGKKDTLSRIKYRGVYFANRLTRIAIKKGVSPQKAQRLLDMYIQNIENMHDYTKSEQLINNMIIDYASQVESLMHSKETCSEFCEDCIRYITGHIFQKIRIENMANEMGYSRSYLCKKFKKEMGMTLNQYIQKEKIEETKRLLRYMNYDLSEIAYTLNFSSQSHFQTVFKKVTGETPLSYQNQYSE